jgi:hypothetical protein
VHSVHYQQIGVAKRVGRSRDSRDEVTGYKPRPDSQLQKVAVRLLQGNPQVRAAFIGFKQINSSVVDRRRLKPLRELEHPLGARTVADAKLDDPHGRLPFDGAEQLAIRRWAAEPQKVTSLAKIGCGHRSGLKEENAIYGTTTSIFRNRCAAGETAEH